MGNDWDDDALRWEAELEYVRAKGMRSGLNDAFLERTGEQERQLKELMAWWLNVSLDELDAYFEEVMLRFYSDLILRFPTARRATTTPTPLVHLLIRMLYKQSMMQMANTLVRETYALDEVEMSRRLHRMLVDSVAEVHQHACRLWNTIYDLMPLQGLVPERLEIPDAGHSVDYGVETP